MAALLGNPQNYFAVSWARKQKINYVVGAREPPDHLLPIPSYLSSKLSLNMFVLFQASAHVLKSDAQRNAMKYDEEKSPKRSISSEEGKYSSQVRD